MHIFWIWNLSKISYIYLIRIHIILFKIILFIFIFSFKFKYESLWKLLVIYFINAQSIIIFLFFYYFQICIFQSIWNLLLLYYSLLYFILVGNLQIHQKILYLIFIRIWIWISYRIFIHIIWNKIIWIL